MLLIDITLIKWYESFFESISKKNQNQFFYNSVKFVFLSGSSALSISTLGYILESLDLELKLILSKIAVKKIENNNSQIKSNQKPIDDATLAAERLSSALPMFIFNVIKIIVLISLLVLWSPNNLFVSTLSISIPYPLLLTSFSFITIQTVIALKYFPLQRRTDNLKRKVENKFRLTLLGISNSSNIKDGLHSYLKNINAIRKHTAFKNFSLTVTLGLIGTLAYVIPYIVMFTFYLNDELDFGELMKLSATFGIFLNSCTYVVNNFRELSKGFAALNRVLN
jgi:ABC-type uncharacterized transport system fused permease/ATPase subunit